MDDSGGSTASVIGGVLGARAIGTTSPAQSGDDPAEPRRWTAIVE